VHSKERLATAAAANQGAVSDAQSWKEKAMQKKQPFGFHMKAKEFQNAVHVSKLQNRHFLDFGFPSPHFPSATLCEKPWTQHGQLCYSKPLVRTALRTASNYAAL
jgi:hypothetical protein